MGRKKQNQAAEDQDVATISATEETINKAIERSGEKADRKVIEIRSAELRDQMFCNYKYKHNIAPNTTNSVSIKSEQPVHPDLVRVFRRFDPHLAVICEEVKSEEIKDIDHIIASDPLFEKIRIFTVTSCTLDGYDDAMSIQLSGLKELSTGEAIKMETPWIGLNDSYPFCVELTSCVQDMITEVEEYMKGKQAADPQQELPFEESFAEEER